MPAQGGMLITRELVPESTLEAFAVKHCLELVVSERRMDRWQRSFGMKRFTAHFRSTEVKRGGCLVSNYGEGDTEAEAIRDYARRISNEVLVVDAMRRVRREIQAPRFVESV